MPQMGREDRTVSMLSCEQGRHFDNTVVTASKKFESDRVVLCDIMVEVSCSTIRDMLERKGIIPYGLIFRSQLGHQSNE